MPAPAISDVGNFCCAIGTAVRLKVAVVCVYSSAIHGFVVTVGDDVISDARDWSYFLLGGAPLFASRFIGNSALHLTPAGNLS